MKRISAGRTFSDSLRERVRAAGYFQKDLADGLGLHPKVLSRKLNGNGDAYLTRQEVCRIIILLAQWQAITTREEAFQLFELAHVDPDSLGAQEWQISPLNKLAGSGTLHRAHTDYTLSRPLLHNLPAQLTRLIGREEAVAQLRQLLEQDEVRLVTLLGPGGSGKTRLAQQAASELVDVFAHGVWFVPLASIHNFVLVPQRIMQVLDVPSAPALRALQSLVTYLQDKQLLLVLDNFEHLGEAADSIGELLAAAPGLKVLTTSRAVLHLYGEREFNVPPLDVPNTGAMLERAKLVEYSAVQLFVERARLVLPDFTLDAENAAAIAQICARVDGLPLALELAAARVKMLLPEQLLAQLSVAPLSLLTGGARNLPGRHQTLRKTIKWSYDLLSPEERAWFARLGTFSGGWSLEAVEAMIQAAVVFQRQEQENVSVLDLLEHLMDNSLLIRLPATTRQVRFTQLETLREYALEQLTEQGERERWQDWHACYYLNLTEAAEIGLKGAQQLEWQARLMAEQDNIRTAMVWSLKQSRAGAMMSDPTRLVCKSTPGLEGTGDTIGNEAGSTEGVSTSRLHAVEVALRLVAALRSYWEWQGYLNEGRGWIDAALVLPLAEEAGKTVLAARAKALSEASRLVCLQGKLDKSVELAEASITLWRQLDDPKGLATALFYRGWPAHALGDHQLAKNLYEQGLELLSTVDDVWLRAQLLFYMGAAAGLTFEFEQMRSFYAQSRALFEQVGDRSALADVLKDEGGMAILEGNYAKAITNLVKSIELCQELGYKHFIATGAHLLGFAVGMQGEPDSRSASLCAAQIWGAKESLMNSMGSNSWIETLPAAQEMFRLIRSRVDEESWDEALHAGRALTEEQAIALCLASR